MTIESKKHNTRIIVWSVIWALALIVAGVVYNGNPAKDQDIAGAHCRRHVGTPGALAPPLR